MSVFENALRERRKTELAATLDRWLVRFFPPKNIAKNETAIADEKRSLLGPLLAYAPETDPGPWAERVLDKLEYQLTGRYWPTKAEVAKACLALRDPGQAKQVSGHTPSRGDRSALSRDQLAKLESDLIPIWREWVASGSSLADHARKSLEFWGEPVTAPRSAF